MRGTNISLATNLWERLSYMRMDSSSAGSGGASVDDRLATRAREGEFKQQGIIFGTQHPFAAMYDRIHKSRVSKFTWP
jgi:hypothetical protein